MTLIEFPEQTTIIIAEDQPEYLPFPCHRVHDDPQGRIVSVWKLTWKERLKVLFGGVVWHQILTFHHPLQPQLLTVDKPEMSTPQPKEEIKP